jgi:hypothetical protein
MEPRLTEFSYGYCVTEQFATGMEPGLWAAPYFPSLYVEGKPGGGFDVRIGSAVFLQFKLCDELTRRTARETKEGLLEPTFFRFRLQRRDQSGQHHMLIDLEGQPGNQVYYIAPGFADVQKLDDAYTSGQVIERSAMFSPAEIGPLPDDEDHRISFRPDQDWAWFRKRIRIHRKAEILDRAHSMSPAVGHQERQDWLIGLGARMIKIIREYQTEGFPHIHSDSVKVLDRQSDPLEWAAYLARTYFGCELFLPAEALPSP